MPRTFNYPTTDGAPGSAPLIKRFAHYVDGTQHWFALHENPQGFGPPVVSEWFTGAGLFTVRATARLYSQRDTIDAAKTQLDMLISVKGAATVAEVLKKAQTDMPHLNPKLV